MDLESPTIVQYQDADVRNRANGPESPWPSWAFWPLLGIILMLAAVIRLAGLGTEDYWLDELHSMANSAGRRAEFEAVPFGILTHDVPRSTELNEHSGLGAVWTTMRQDSHPPLYFGLLLGWRRLVGNGEVAVRCLALTFSVLSILPVALIFRRLKRDGAGLCAAALLALAFTHVQMGQQNRPYSLSILLTCWCALLLVSILTRSPERSMTGAWVAYGVCAYLALMNHYFAGAVLLAQCLFAFVFYRGTRLKGFAITLAVIAAGFIVTWGPSLWAQMDFIRNQPWLHEDLPDHVGRTLYRWADLPIRLLVCSPPFQFNAVRSMLGLLLFVGLTWGAWRVRGPACLLFALWFGLGSMGFALLDLFTERQLLSHLRYSAVFVPGLVGLFVSVLEEFRPLIRGAACVALAAVMVIRLQLPAAFNPDSRGAVEQLRSVVQDGDPVVFEAVGWPRDWIHQFFTPIAYYYPEMKGPVLLLRDPPTADIQNHLAAFPRIVVISPRIDAVPNPCPDTHTLSSQSDYFYQIGWIYVFSRTAT
jgi:hypothetical protein